MSILVDVPAELEEYLAKEAQRLHVPLNILLTQTIEERWGAASRAQSLTSQETELLLKIQNSFDPEQTREYLDLCRKSDDETITDVERQRLLKLIEDRDLRNADRLQALGELARLRGVSLHDVMKQLSIRPE